MSNVLCTRKNTYQVTATAYITNTTYFSLKQNTMLYSHNAPFSLLQYVIVCERMEAACEGWARELLSRAVFRAWLRATTTARREGWERERRAKMHHIRSV